MAQVTTRGSSLQVYAVPDASSRIIGSIPNGEYITVSSTRTVLSTVWARFTSANYVNSWAIVKSPSANYNYIDLNKASPEPMSIVGINDGKSGTAQTTVNVKNEEDVAAVGSKKGEVTKEDITVVGATGKNKGSIFTAQLDLGKLNDGSTRNGSTGSPLTNPPSIVQNDRGYPFIKGTYNGRFMYDYATDYSDPNLVKAMDLVRDSINLSLSNPKTIFNWSAANYNRFKVVNPNEALTKAFPHIFFIRPDCEIIDGIAGNGSLGYNVCNVPLYALYHKKCPQVIYSLVRNCTSDHGFMMLLSNHAEGIDIRDRGLEADTYGKSFMGNSIAYGKHMDKASAAGEFSVQYTDDYDLHVMKVHELWMDYISGVKTGRYTPTEANILNKVIDYAASVFYVVCGPDGETIIYITKYVGVFPTNVPDSVMGFQKGNVITNPNYSITYQYSWIEPNTPEVIMDFNMASSSSYVAEASYQPDILSTGTTWVGAPFIQSETQIDGTTEYKLRFRHLEKRGR